MKFLSSYDNTIQADNHTGSLTRTSVERVSRGYRTDKLNRKNYGIYVNGGWYNVYVCADTAHVKVHQGEYVWVDSFGRIARDSEVSVALEAIDKW